MKDIQKKVNKVFLKYFGRTPLNQRLEDIQGETFELIRYTDMQNLKEELGDLLSSSFSLATECGWNVEDLINNTLDKIKKRENQYKSLGRKIKVAILGGAFNPVTEGHIKVAQLVLNSTKTFDEVWLMPCYQHMYNKSLESVENRLNMLNIAIKKDGRIKVFDYEIKNKLKGETYNLVKRLQNEDFAKNQYDFSFIIGLDNANTFDQWVNYEHLEKMIRFVVVPRRGIKRDKNVNWYLKQPHIYIEGGEKDLIEISSSEIKEKYWNSDLKIKEIKGLDNDVFEYIKKNKLYLKHC